MLHHCQEAALFIEAWMKAEVTHLAVIIIIIIIIIIIKIVLLIIIIICSSSGSTTALGGLWLPSQL